eukprot:509505_1
MIYNQNCIMCQTVHFLCTIAGPISSYSPAVIQISLNSDVDDMTNPPIHGKQNLDSFFEVPTSGLNDVKSFNKPTMSLYNAFVGCFLFISLKYPSINVLFDTDALTSFTNL